MNTKQARQILLLKEDSTYEEIRYAYRKLALELHPDKNEKESDGKKFKMITEAYYFLKNQHKSTHSHNKKSTTKKGFSQYFFLKNPKKSPKISQNRNISQYFSQDAQIHEIA